MSHVPGSQPNGQGTDLAWLYHQDASDARLAGGESQTLLLPLPVAPPPQSAARGPVIFLIGLLLALTAGAIFGMVVLLQSDSRTAASGSGQSSALRSPDDLPGAGAAVTPTGVTVGCQAPQTTDAAGHPVSYMPG